MLGDNRLSAFPIIPDRQLLEQQGIIIPAMDQLSVSAAARSYFVEGNGTVTSLPSLPRGIRVDCVMIGAPTFVNSSRLICPGGAADFTPTPESGATFISKGNGVWLVFPWLSTTSFVQPQGRITLLSGDPAPKSSQANVVRHYYTPASGVVCPITLDGSNFYMQPFSEVSQDLSDTTKSPAASIAGANYDLFAWLDGSTFRVTRGDYWKTPALAVTISIGSPAVVTIASGVTLNTEFPTPVVLSTSGALYTGLTAGTTYWLQPLSSTTANIAATATGTAINTSGSQSGSHTAVVGDNFGEYRTSNSPFTVVKGMPLNTNAITNGPGALLGVYVGSVRTSSSNLLNFVYGGISGGGSPAIFHVYNHYNKAFVLAFVGDNSATWTYTTAAWRMMNNSNGNRVSFLMGMLGNPIDVKRGYYISTAAVLGAYAFIGYALDKYTSNVGTAGDGLEQVLTSAAFSLSRYGTVITSYPPQVGSHYIQAIELGDGSNANSFAGATQGKLLEVGLWL